MFKFNHIAVPSVGFSLVFRASNHKQKIGELGLNQIFPWIVIGGFNEILISFEKKR